jgi:hypothetical protein
VDPGSPHRASERPAGQALGRIEADDAGGRAGHPEAREVPDIWHQFAAPFVVDGTAFDTAFRRLHFESHKRKRGQ